MITGHPTYKTWSEYFKQELNPVEFVHMLQSTRVARPSKRGEPMAMRVPHSGVDNGIMEHKEILALCESGGHVFDTRNVLHVTELVKGRVVQPVVCIACKTLVYAERVGGKCGKAK